MRMNNVCKAPFNVHVHLVVLVLLLLLLLLLVVVVLVSFIEQHQLEILVHTRGRNRSAGQCYVLLWELRCKSVNARLMT